MNLDNLAFIDLFAGIGGFHQSLKDFGARCVFAAEWDKHAAETYRENYQLEPNGDITQISELDIPAHEILCAGFPCQAFSISGKQRGFNDTRGTLFFDIARIAKHHQPKLLFLENVRNLARHDKGRTLSTILSTLDELGYQVHHKVLNASHFGLPQNRERIYFVCFRKDIAPESFTFPVPPHVRIALLDFLEEAPVDAKIVNRPDMFITKTYEPTIDLFGDVQYPNRPIQIGYVNKGGQGERIYDPYGHAITLSAYGGGVGSKTGLYKVGDIIRKLSPRECARIQGFPDTFQIISSKSQAYKQFGNSVAINVLKGILEQVSKLEEHAEEG